MTTRSRHGDPAGGVCLVTWNLNHRGRHRAIPFAVLQVIHAIRPDVVAFTEYVPGPSHFVLTEGLASLGLAHRAMSEGVSRENRILLASRWPMTRGGIQPPRITPAVPANVLHVRLPRAGIDVVAMRIPDYSRSPATKRAVWDWLENVAAATVTAEAGSAPCVVLGDFNTDVHYPRALCGDRPERLGGIGWRMVIPFNSYSFWSPRGDPVRIDHAYLSPGIELRRARYVTTIDGFVLVTPGGGALSDHAALVVEVQPTLAGPWRESEERPYRRIATPARQCATSLGWLIALSASLNWKSFRGFTSWPSGEYAVS